MPGPIVDGSIPSLVLYYPEREKNRQFVCGKIASQRLQSITSGEGDEHNSVVPIDYLKASTIQGAR